MFDMLKRIGKFIRWKDWGPGKIPIFFTTLTYIALLNKSFTLSVLLDSALFLVFAVLHSALGFVANDWGDRNIDKIQGKPNGFENMSRSQGLIALSTIFVLAFLSGLPFISRSMVLPLWVGWAFFAVGYSIYPIRLKERGIWGLGVSSLAQWTFPILLTFAAMGRFSGLDMFVFVLANTISGVTLEIAHQRHDRTRDISTATATFGTRTNPSMLDQLYSASLWLDKLAIGILIITIAFQLNTLKVSWGGHLLGLPLMFLYAVLIVVAIYEIIWLSKRGDFLDPYYSTKKNANKLLHETLINVALPSYLLLLATIFQPAYSILLITFLYWRLVLGQADLRLPLNGFRGLISKLKLHG